MNANLVAHFRHEGCLVAPIKNSTKANEKKFMMLFEAIGEEAKSDPDLAAAIVERTEVLSGKPLDFASKLAAETVVHDWTFFMLLQKVSNLQQENRDLKEEHQTVKDDCGTYFELANELEEELKELKEMSNRKIILLEKEVDAARQDAAAARQDAASARQDAADVTLRLQTAQETFERELEAARQEAADATLRLQTAQETIERQAAQICATGEPVLILQKGSLQSVNSLLLQSLEDNCSASAEDQRLPEFVEDAGGFQSDAVCMERAEGDCDTTDYYLLGIFGGGLRQRIAEKFRVVQVRLGQGQHEELSEQEQHEANNHQVPQQKLPRHTPTCSNADTSLSGRAVSSFRKTSHPNKITTTCASVNSRSLHQVKAPCREHARVLTYTDAGSAEQYVQGVIFHKDTPCQTIFLLVQDLKLEGAPPEGDVCATVSLSQRGTGEASVGVVAMTPYKELRKRMTAWNDILMLQHLPGSVIMDLRVSVWSRTSEGDDLLLAHSTFMLNGLYDGFSDEHLDLRIDQGAHSLVDKLTLRIGASWSKGDVEMLQKGLLPSSARNSLRATDPLCQPKLKHDQVRVLDRARNIVANEQGMDLSASSSPETDTDNDEGQMIMQAVTSWPLKGRIVVNCWAPFNIVKIDEAAQDLLGCETRLTEGRSVAACARARVDNEEGASTFDSTNILLACSHVAGCGQGHRAFLLMNDGIFVLVQQEELQILRRANWRSSCSDHHHSKSWASSQYSGQVTVTLKKVIACSHLPSPPQI